MKLKRHDPTPVKFRKILYLFLKNRTNVSLSCFFTRHASYNPGEVLLFRVGKQNFFLHHKSFFYGGGGAN